MSETMPLETGAGEQPHLDAPVERPHRDRPFTGDDAVDAVLRQFDEAAGEPLGDQLAAAEQAHRALQGRLGS